MLNLIRVGVTEMSKWRKRPVIVEACQWFPYRDNEPMLYEVVTPYLSAENCKLPDRVNVDGGSPCLVCGKQMFDHGWIATLEGGHIVCPSDWIITGVKGERYPCKPDIFREMYDRVE